MIPRAIAIALPVGLAASTLLVVARSYPWSLALLSGFSVALLAFVSVLSVARLLRQTRGPLFRVESSLGSSGTDEEE